MSPRSAFTPIHEPSCSIASADGIESDLTNDSPIDGGIDSPPPPILTTPLLVEDILAETSGHEMTLV